MGPPPRGEGRTLWERFTSRMNPPVFIGAALVIVAFVAFGGIFTETAAATFQWTQSKITRFLGWYYALVVTACLVFTIVIVFTGMRRIRLGGHEAKPAFGLAAWFTMLFAAGMGIGLVFWGVSEPLLHYANPLHVEGRTEAARAEAMILSYFHWGLHAWAIYIVLALAVAYFHFNRGLPLAPRIVLHPILGDRIDGWIGHFVDILCTVGTLLGVAASLGLGAMQINTSLTEFFGWPDSTGVQIALILVITAAATVSVVLGVKSGIRRLSLANLGLAGVLMLFVLVAGPTLYILELLVSTFGGYLERLPRLSLYLDPGRGSDWQATWTLFYWGWWISWSPFVAIFVARISEGRTVGEFVAGVLLVPALVTFAWFAVFGGTALYLQETGTADLIPLVEENNAASLQALLAQLPLGTVTTVLATLLITIFFITSSDSGSLVDDMVTSGGDPNPPRSQRVFWACSEGAVAAILLLVGGLSAIRNAAISFGLLMSVLLLVAMYSIWVGMRADTRVSARARTW